MRPRVFVVHNPSQKYDLTPAEKFGTIVEVLSADMSPLTGAQEIIDSLHAKLKDYDGRLDYIVLIGNPVFIGLCCAIALDYAEGDAQLLQWDNRYRKYEPVLLTNVFRDAGT